MLLSELDLFWKLSEGNDHVRIAATKQLVVLIQEKQANNDEACDEVQHVLKKLVRGLSSTKKFTRLGYSTTLAGILRDVVVVRNAQFISAVQEELGYDKSVSKGEKSNMALGFLMAVLAFIQAKRIPVCTCEEIHYFVEEILNVQKEKPLLHNLCTHALTEITKQVGADLFSEAVFPLLKPSLSNGWEDCTADWLQMLIAAHTVQAEMVSKQFLEQHWDEKKLLSGANSENIANMLIQSTTDHPILHPLTGDLLRYAASKGKLVQTWENVVLGHLFDTKRMPVDLLFLRALPIALSLCAAVEEIRGVLTDKILAYLMKNLSQKKCLLHKATLHMMEELYPVMTSWKDVHMCVAFVMTFLETSVGVFFDNTCQTPFVDSLIRNMQAEAGVVFSEILMDVITGTHSIGPSSYEDQCRFAATELCHMTTMSSLSTNHSWQLGVTRFLCLLGNFSLIQPTPLLQHGGKKPAKELTPALQKCLQDAFKQALGKLSTFQNEKSVKDRTVYLNLLRELTIYCQELLKSPHVALWTPFTEESQENWERVVAVTAKYRTQDHSRKLLTKDLTFELAFYQMALELFTDPAGANEVLEDLFICHERAFEKKRKKNEDEPHWIEVLTDLLLSLLSRPSLLMRTVVNSMFTVVCEHLTPEAFQLIVEALQSSGADEGPLNFEDDDEEEEGMEAEAEDRDATSSAPESESRATGASSSEEESEGEAVSAHLRENVKAALGRAAVSSDAESASDLSDSEMEKFDEVLSSAFNSLRKGAKKDDRDRATLLKTYKLRCLDLLDILIQAEHKQHTFYVDILEPLLMLLDETQKEKQMQDLHHKAQKTFKALCRVKHAKGHSISETMERIRHFFSLSTKVTGIPMVIATGQAIVFLAKTIMTKAQEAETEVEARPGKKRCKNSTGHENPTELLSTTVMEHLRKFCEKTDTLLSQVLFNELFTGFPELAWPIMEPMVHIIGNSEMKVFRRTQVCVMISSAITKSSVSEVTFEKWLAIASKSFKKLLEVLEDALKATAQNQKFLADLLNLLYKLAANTPIDTIKTYIPESLCSDLEEVKKKFKDNTDLKRVCNKFRSHLVTVCPSLVPQAQQGKRKRKNSGARVSESKDTEMEQGTHTSAPAPSPQRQNGTKNKKKSKNSTQSQQQQNSTQNKQSKNTTLSQQQQTNGAQSKKSKKKSAQSQHEQEVKNKTTSLVSEEESMEVETQEEGKSKKKKKKRIRSSKKESTAQDTQSGSSEATSQETTGEEAPSSSKESTAQDTQSGSSEATSQETTGEEAPSSSIKESTTQETTGEGVKKKKKKKTDKD